jgi:hypothetical protein
MTPALKGKAVELLYKTIRPLLSSEMHTLQKKAYAVNAFVFTRTSHLP